MSSQLTSHSEEMPSVWIERWNDEYVVPQCWQSMAVFNHPTYPCGRHAMVGDIVRCRHLDRKYGVKTGFYCVVSVHCERRGDRQHPYVIVGNVFANVKDDPDDLIEASEVCNNATMQKAKRAILKSLEYVGHITEQVHSDQ